jgi:hypothetical protein
MLKQTVQLLLPFSFCCDAARSMFCLLNGRCQGGVQLCIGACHGVESACVVTFVTGILLALPCNALS